MEYFAKISPVGPIITIIIGCWVGAMVYWVQRTVQRQKREMAMLQSRIDSLEDTVVQNVQLQSYGDLNKIKKRSKKIKIKNVYNKDA